MDNSKQDGEHEKWEHGEQMWLLNRISWMWGVSLGCQHRSVSGVIERCVFNKDRTNYTRDWFFSWSVNERFRRELRFSRRCLLAYTYKATTATRITEMEITKTVITTITHFLTKPDTRRSESLNLVNPITFSRVVLPVQLFNRHVVCSSIEQGNHTVNNQRSLAWCWCSSSSLSTCPSH